VHPFLSHEVPPRIAQAPSGRAGERVSGRAGERASGRAGERASVSYPSRDGPFRCSLHRCTVQRRGTRLQPCRLTLVVHTHDPPARPSDHVFATSLDGNLTAAVGVFLIGGSWTIPRNL
jgi:hypothetical protein